MTAASGLSRTSAEAGSGRDKGSLEVSAPPRARERETAFADYRTFPPCPTTRSIEVARVISTVAFGETHRAAASSLSRTSAAAGLTLTRGLSRLLAKEAGLTVTSGLSRIAAGFWTFLEIFAEGVAHVLEFLSQLCLQASRRAQRSDSVHTSGRGWKQLEDMSAVVVFSSISLFRAVTSCCVSLNRRQRSPKLPPPFMQLGPAEKSGGSSARIYEAKRLGAQISTTLFLLPRAVVGHLIALWPWLCQMDSHHRPRAKRG